MTRKEKAIISVMEWVDDHGTAPAPRKAAFKKQLHNLTVESLESLDETFQKVYDAGKKEGRSGRGW